MLAGMIKIRGKPLICLPLVSAYLSSLESYRKHLYVAVIANYRLSGQTKAIILLAEYKFHQSIIAWETAKIGLQTMVLRVYCLKKSPRVFFSASVMMRTKSAFSNVTMRRISTEVDINFHLVQAKTVSLISTNEYVSAAIKPNKGNPGSYIGRKQKNQVE